MVPDGLVALSRNFQSSDPGSIDIHGDQREKVGAESSLKSRDRLRNE